MTFIVKPLASTLYCLLSRVALIASRMQHPRHERKIIPDGEVQATPFDSFPLLSGILEFLGQGVVIADLLLQL